jgi:GntR family transcriptional regulator / MocR family aminotransferase
VKLFSLDQENNKQAKYLQLASVIRLAIRKGQFIAGDSLPSVKSLSNDSNLNRHTVMKALAELIAEGWVESAERVGYKVVDHLPIEHSLRLSKDDKSQQSEFKYRLVRLADNLPEHNLEEITYNFSGGLADLSRFPFAEFKSHMADSLSRPNLSQLGYGETAGTRELVAQVKSYLRKARGITDRKIIITNGSQEAMFITAQLLLQQGDKVAVEELGYPPAMSVFKSAGAELVAIKQDKQGIVPEALEMAIIKGNIRLIYLTPLHQYPTTVTLSVSRRMQIYQLAARHQIPILEDDYDHEFHYRCQPLAPMASQDPKQLVIYVSTFSKIMFPGARIGIMAVNKNLAQAITDYRLLMCHKSNVLMQSSLARWMASGDFERHLRRTARCYLQRRDHAVALLKTLDIFDFEIPDGGMALWLRIKNDKVKASELAKVARLSGIYIQHEADYQLLKNPQQDSYIRVGFAGMNESDFAKGMQLLVTLLKTQFSDAGRL